MEKMMGVKESGMVTGMENMSGTGLGNMEKRERERRSLKDLKNDNRGIGVVEIILILVILIGLVLLFQNEIKGIVNDALDAISGGADKIID